MADTETIVICGLVANGPYPFDDNVEELCEGCGAAIIHRPHAPKGRYMCRDCAMEHVEQAEAEGEVPQFAVTQQTLDDLKELGWGDIVPPSQMV